VSREQFEHELAVARDLCAEASNIIASRGFSIRLKNDQSPVTTIDTQCEQLYIDRLRRYFPTDAIVGEEYGEQHGSSGRRWIIDPIDGTRPFIRDIPTYSTMIALEAEGELVLGCIYLPGLSLSCWARKGHGAFLNAQPIRVSQTPTLQSAMVAALGTVHLRSEQRGQQLLTLLGNCDYPYGFMDSYSYVCVASGRLDAAISLLDKPWDSAAAACIVSEAGGAWSSIEGTESIFEGSFICSNAALIGQLQSHFLR